MKLKKEIRIELTHDERNTLRKADEIITEIIDALIDNKENGNAAFQEGMNAPECFWSIYHHMNAIVDGELIP